MYNVGEYVQVKWVDKQDRKSGVQVDVVYKITEKSYTIIKCVDAQGNIYHLSTIQVRPSTKELFK